MGTDTDTDTDTDTELHLAQLHKDLIYVARSFLTLPTQQLAELILQKIADTASAEILYLNQQNSEASFWVAVDYVCSLNDSKFQSRGEQLTAPSYFVTSASKDLLSCKMALWGDTFAMEWCRRFDTDAYNFKKRMLSMD